MSEEILDANTENIQIVKKKNIHIIRKQLGAVKEINMISVLKIMEYDTIYHKIHCKDEVVCDKCDKTVLRSTKTSHQKSLPCRLADIENTIFFQK